MSSLVRAKDLGAYYTPDTMADVLAAWVVQTGQETLLEPSIGNGSLLRAALSCADRKSTSPSGLRFIGCDLDKDAIAGVRTWLPPFPIVRFSLREKVLENIGRDSSSDDLFDLKIEKDDFLPGTPCAIQGEWRGLLQSPGPRIPVLPLDPVLAIDFCLSQSDGSIWNRLRNIPEYFDVIEEAQTRLWLPFFESLKDTAFRRSWFGPSLLI